MSLFRIDRDNVVSIKEVTFNREKELQNLVEANLDNLMNLTMVRSEFKVGNYRLDTLAYNSEKKSFVIIEYKNSRKDSVIDQGYTYLNTMLEQKATFVLGYNEQFPNDRKKIRDIDWSQSEIVFISPKFSDYQKAAASNPKLPIVLIQAKYFEGDILELDEISKSNYIISAENNLEMINKLSKEIKVYTEEMLVEKGTEKIKFIFQNLRETILEWDPSINVGATKLYIYFKLKTNFCDIAVQKNQIKIWLNFKFGELWDPKNLFEDVSNKGHHGNGDYQAIIKDNSEIEYVLSVIKEAWEKAK